jgi:hypothetical protein
MEMFVNIQFENTISAIFQNAEDQGKQNYNGS